MSFIMAADRISKLFDLTIHRSLFPFHWAREIEWRVHWIFSKYKNPSNQSHILFPSTNIPDIFYIGVLERERHLDCPNWNTGKRLSLLSFPARPQFQSFMQKCQFLTENAEMNVTTTPARSSRLFSPRNIAFGAFRELSIHFFLHLELKEADVDTGGSFLRHPSNLVDWFRDTSLRKAGGDLTSALSWTFKPSPFARLLPASASSTAKLIQSAQV